MGLEKSAEQKRREERLAIVRDPRNWMIASEQEELDKELADKLFTDRDVAMDEWLKFRFKQTREEFLASRRMIKSTTEHAESVISQRSIQKPIGKLPPSSLIKSQEKPPRILKKIIPLPAEDSHKRNVDVGEKARELKLLKSYNFTAKSGEKITITKLSRELCGNEGDLHRNFNCKLARECLGFVILRNINYFSCVKCEQYSLDYRVLSRY